MSQSTCRACGAPVRWVTLAPTREYVALDATAEIDGRYRIRGEDSGVAERIERPGEPGHKLHSETCHKQ